MKEKRVAHIHVVHDTLRSLLDVLFTVTKLYFSFIHNFSIDCVKSKVLKLQFIRYGRNFSLKH